MQLTSMTYRWKACPDCIPIRVPTQARESPRAHGTTLPRVRSRSQYTLKRNRHSSSSRKCGSTVVSTTTVVLYCSSTTSSSSNSTVPAVLRLCSAATGCIYGCCTTRNTTSAASTALCYCCPVPLLLCAAVARTYVQWVPGYTPRSAERSNTV